MHLRVLMTDNISSWSEQEEGVIRDQLSAVLGSVLFAHAERLGRFLRFVVDETLAGRADRLNQFAIAIDVFDRDEPSPWNDASSAASAKSIIPWRRFGATGGLW